MSILSNKAKCWYFVLVLLLSVFTGVNVLAQDQSSSRGNLSGIVLDASKATVPGATVAITGPIGTRTQETNDKGGFLFLSLVPGFYVIKVHNPGFKTASIPNVEVLINKTSSVEAVLETGEVTQTGEV